MSSKTSQRRPKSAAATPTPTPAPAAPAPEVEKPVVKVVPEISTTSAAPSSRGSKRKASALEETPKKADEEAKPEKKLKGGKKSDKTKEVKEPAKEPKSGKPKKAKVAKEEPMVAATEEKPLAAGGEPAPAEASDGNPSVGRYLRALLKVKYAESTISKEAIQEVQRLVYQFGLHFLVTVKRHLESARKNTLMMFDMPICLQRVLSASDLYADFSGAMSSALTRYYASYPQDKGDAKDNAEVAEGVNEKRKQMWAARAGLSIPPTRIKEFAKLYLSNFRFSQNSITGLTALLERLATLVFQLSFEKAQELNRKRISHADVQAAVSGHANLQWLLIAPVLPIV